LCLDHEDGHGLEDLIDGKYRIIVDGSTQLADGTIGRLKPWLNLKRGARRSTIKAG